MRLLPARSAAVLAAGLLVAFGACASGQPAGTSFTSLDAAQAQAHRWVDEAVATAAPKDATEKVNDYPSESCDSNSGRASGRYEVRVTTPADAVDPTAIAVWRSLAGQGFTLGPNSAPASGTDPVPPGAGSPSWTITGSHDGFTAEVVGNRADPGVRVWIATPCFGT